MSAQPSFPPIRLPDDVALVASNTAQTIQDARVADMLEDLREAVRKNWWVSGLTGKREYAPAVVCDFAAGIDRIDALRYTALSFHATGHFDLAARSFNKYMEAAMQYAAEELLAAADSGQRITFGPLQ